MKKRVISFLFLFFFAISVGVGLSEIGAHPEYQIKALILVRIAADVEWPEKTGVNDKAKPFVIGVIGSNPFEFYLKDAVSDKKIKDKNVEIIYLSNYNDILKCHVLFITQSCEGDLTKILQLTRTRPILTVSDTKGFSEKGVLINITENETAHRRLLVVNEKKLYESQLKVNPRVLAISQIINPLQK
ncbi:MAG: YfiR family protein [Candidatus Omnitrophota bacterium]